MTDEIDLTEPQAQPEPAPAEELPPAPPIKDRFLFVDVAALRAKQLRRGARPRLKADAPMPLKPERIAMEEVRQGLVHYELPPLKGRTQDNAA
ncbi:MAG TPA: DNA-directed RNA polymerase subunit omega [Vicinamibacterales bacterium]|nr:DNA-directed RNA polymerase subunit omega [Vicinamibacterales bacterium]